MKALIEFLQTYSSLEAIPFHPGLIQLNGYYHRRYPGTLPTMYTRKSVLLKLQNILEVLGSGYQFVLFDTYRSLTTQNYIWDLYWQQIRAKHPEMSDDTVTKTTDRFVFNPKSHPDLVPGHNSGGSIDLSLSFQGQLLDMGGDFDETTPVAATAFFEQKFDPDLGISEERWLQIRKNRKLLLSCFEAEGFTNYEEEWWHFDLGSCFWQRRTGSSFTYPSGDKEIPTGLC